MQVGAKRFPVETVYLDELGALARRLGHDPVSTLDVLRKRTGCVLSTASADLIQQTAEKFSKALDSYGVEVNMLLSSSMGGQLGRKDGARGKAASRRRQEGCSEGGVHLGRQEGCSERGCIWEGRKDAARRGVHLGRQEGCSEV